MKEYFNAWNHVFEGHPNPFWKLLTKFSDLKYAWEKASPADLKLTGMNDEYINRFVNLKKTFDPCGEIEKINRQGINIVTSQEPQYPKELHNLHNHITPIILYYKGRLIPSEIFSVGIVGTRNMTGYGESTTKRLVAELSLYKPAIISGMADGIDSVAHRSAIENNLVTFAILGFGINQIPYHKLNFAEKIIQNGAVISEYPPDTKALKYYFPLRNRIISGLSRALVVVEAGERSGALITARCALEQNREVFVVPGNLGNEKSAGTNRLLRDSCANILTAGEDIINHYKIPVIRKNPAHNVSGRQALLIDKLKKSPCTKEDLLQLNLFSPGELNASLTEFEMKGLVNKNHEGRFFLNN